MSLSSLLAVGAGVASGLLYIGASFGSPLSLMLSNFALLPLFVAGLGIGAIGTAIAAIVGAAVVAVTVSIPGGAIFLVFHGIPATLLCRQALLSRTTPDNQTEWYPGGLLLTWVLAIAMFYYLLVALYFAIADDGLVNAIRVELDTFIDAIDDVIPVQNAEAIRGLAPIVPGISAGFFTLNLVLNGALAQHLLRRSGRNLRPSITLSDLTLPPQLLYLLAACAAVTLISDTFGPIALTLAFIIVVAYFLLGLAVVHAHLKRRSNPGTALFGFYVIFILLLLLFMPVGLAIVGLGILEQLVGLRRRFIAHGAGEEDD